MNQPRDPHRPGPVAVTVRGVPSQNIQPNPFAIGIAYIRLESSIRKNRCTFPLYGKALFRPGLLESTTTFYPQTLKMYYILTGTTSTSVVYS